MRRAVVGATRPQRPFAPTGGPSRQGLGLAPPPCLQDHLQAVPADGADWAVATPPFDRAQTVVERTLALLAPPRGCFDRHGRARAATHFRWPARFSDTFGTTGIDDTADFTSADYVAPNAIKGEVVKAGG